VCGLEVLRERGRQPKAEELLGLGEIKVDGGKKKRRGGGGMQRVGRNWRSEWQGALQSSTSSRIEPGQGAGREGALVP